MNKKNLMTFGLIALGLFFLTRKKDDDASTDADSSDNVLPASDTPTPPAQDQGNPVVAAPSGSPIQTTV